MSDSLEVIQQTRRTLQAWMENVRKLPDPAYQPVEALSQISEQLKSVDAAIRRAPPALLARREWRDELAAYRETLCEIRVTLTNSEMPLRIRQLLSGQAQHRLAAIRSWSDLARNIG